MIGINNIQKITTEVFPSHLIEGAIKFVNNLYPYEINADDIAKARQTLELQTIYKIYSFNHLNGINEKPYSLTYATLDGIAECCVYGGTLEQLETEKITTDIHNQLFGFYASYYCEERDGYDTGDEEMKALKKELNSKNKFKAFIKNRSNQYTELVTSYNTIIYPVSNEISTN